jgi:hypothetical protein
VKAYDGFGFIIDVGSSLGLWIGVSALGFFDFLLTSVDVLLSLIRS